MHRSICRVIRGTCRKWRDSDCPAVGGEEIRKGGNKSNEEFVPPPKYSFTDAVGWTAGLVLAYEFTHRRNRTLGVVEEAPLSSVCATVKCPFVWPKKAVTQPILSQSVISVNQKSSIGSKKTSIDLTPFIKEDSVANIQFTLSHQSCVAEDEDDSVIFSNDIENIAPTSGPKYSSPLLTKKVDSELPSDRISSARRLTGDLFSVLGAFKFLAAETSSKKGAEEPLVSFSDGMSSDEPPMTAMELLEKGAEIGSARALYNIGVAYERLNDEQIAREYYRKASDLGHPLGTYNNAVYLLKDGRISEGLCMMQKAADQGVPEAKRIVSTVPTSASPPVLV